MISSSSNVFNCPDMAPAHLPRVDLHHSPHALQVPSTRVVEDRVSAMVLQLVPPPATTARPLVPASASSRLHDPWLIGGLVA